MKSSPFSARHTYLPPATLPRPAPSAQLDPGVALAPARRADGAGTSLAFDVWYPRPFTSAMALLGPHHAAREQALQAWSIAIEPPPQHARLAPQAMGVRDIGRYLEAALLRCDNYTSTRAYIGGSAVSWVQGSTQQVHRPHDVDVAIFVTRRPHVSLEELRIDVTQALRKLYTQTLNLDAQASAALRLHTPILQSPDSNDRILSVRLGTAEQHIDVRFVFTDSRFRLYDFVCNALCCSLYDSSVWSVMPGADVQQVFADIRDGVYRMDHTLSDGSIVRAWKMHRRGLATADMQQERMLWEGLARSLMTGGAHDTKGPGLRLAELLARETDVRRNGASIKTHKAALALFINARLSLAAAGMHPHQTLVDKQLAQRITALLAQVALSPKTRDVLTMLSEASGPARLWQWCRMFARTTDALAWPESAEDVVIERAGGRTSTQLRLFVSELDAFVILHAPPRFVPYASHLSSVAAAPGARADDARVLAAQACGDSRLAAWAPKPRAPDSDTAHAWAQALLAQLDLQGPKAPHIQARWVLASLALSPKVLLTAQHIGVVRQALGAYAANVVLDAHLCGRIEAACQALTQDHDAACTPSTDAARTQAWASLWLAAPCLRRSQAHTSSTAHMRLFQAAAARIIRTLAHAPDKRAVDTPHIATLLMRAAVPDARHAPDDLAAWLLWRAHVSADVICGIDALRAPLRPALRVARRAVAQGYAAWLTQLLGAAVAQPGGVVLCLNLHALVPCPAACMPTAVAQRILTSLPATGGHAHHVAAAQTALASLAHKRAALTHTAHQGAWLRRMLLSASTRLSVFNALSQAACVIDAKLADVLMPPLLVFDTLKHTAAHLLATPAAREVFSVNAAAHLWASADRAVLVSRWRHIYLMLNQAQAVSGCHATALAKCFVAHYASVPVPDGPPAEPLNFLETVITTGLAESSDTTDPGLGIGHARLMLVSRDRVALALPALRKHASAAMAHPTLAPAFVDCIMTLLAQLSPEDAHARDMCHGLARCITQAPHIAPQVQDAAAEMAAQLIVFCSTAHMPVLAGEALVHVHEHWGLPHVGALLNARITAGGRQAETRAWMRTLVDSVAPDEMRAGVCLPLLDARLVAMLERYIKHTPGDNASVFQACLAMLLPTLRVREGALAAHPLDALSQTLMTFFRQAPQQSALRQMLFSEPKSRDVHARLWVGIWTCWCGSAPSPSEARLRARLVFDHLRIDLSACTTDVLPCPDALDIAVPLVALATTDVSDGQFCMERWTQLVALCCKQSPKLWWLDALCEASPRHRRQLLAHVAEVLTEQLRAACAKQTGGLSPEADRQTALTLLYVVAHHVDELEEAVLVDAAQAALDAAGPHLTHDPASWHVLVQRVQAFAPTLSARLDPYLARIVQAKLPATGAQVRQHVSLDALRSENMAVWLRMTTPDKFIYAFEALAAMEASWSWQPAARVYSWRTAVGAILRRPHGVEAMTAYLTETVITPDSLAQPAWALNCLYDALWDTGMLNAELVTLLLRQMLRSQRQPQTHVPLTRLTKQLTRSAWHPDVQLGAGPRQAAQAWAQAVRHHASLHDAAQQLVEAMHANCAP